MDRIDTSRWTWRGRSTPVSLLLAIALLGVACGGAPTPTGSAGPGSSSSPETSASPGSGADLGDLAWIFETPVEPVDVAVALDAGKKAEALIPIEGGSLSATGADGTVFTLDIPKDALLTETTIGLTPVASLSGMPFGNEQTYAVQLSPDGLFLYDVAILTITPADPIPKGEQIVFGYLKDGKDVILAAPVLDSSEIKIEVLHFSGNGVTRGLLADIEPERQRLGGDAARRIEDALNIERNRISQEGGEWQSALTVAAMGEALVQFEEQVLGPRVAAAGESCAAGRLAIETANTVERQRQLLGLSEGVNPMDRYPGLVDTATRVCVLEEFELCVEDHVIHRMAMVWRHFEHQYALLAIPDDRGVLREARELTIKCLTFTLKFESTGIVDLDDGGYESRVTSDITLRFDPDSNKISGEAPLVNEAFSFRAPCGATGVTGGGTFEVGNLKILTGHPDEFQPDDVNFLLTYLPGATSESAKVKICGSSGAPLALPAFPAWTSTFLATHKDELDTAGTYGGGYAVTGFEIFGDEYFAKVEWIKEFDHIIEAGTFKLYHTPGA